MTERQRLFDGAGALALITLLLLLPTHSRAECTCDVADEESLTMRVIVLALKYKIVAIATILVGGAIGVCVPIFGNKVPELNPGTNTFYMIKAFAAGVILSTGFIHVLPNAFENLTSPCLSESPWAKFPFTGFVAMVASMCTLMIDAFTTSFYMRKKGPSSKQVSGIDEEVQGSHTVVKKRTTQEQSHGSVAEETSVSEIRHRVITKVLELGIVVHSVIIGISLGASNDLNTIKPLIAALSFHQFFEGLGLGGCIAQAKFKASTIATMVLFFSLTAPIGIVIGIGLSSFYKENSQHALILPGILDSASAGILIYTALVDLLAADFMSQKIQSNVLLQVGASILLFLGAGCMSLLAIWA